MTTSEFKAKLIAEIESFLRCYIYEEISEEALQALDKLKDFINSLPEEQEYIQPEYSCFETIYKCGKKSHWNVGDTLAYYEFCSDREGECVLGKVANVRFNEEQSDWIYTFEDGCRYDEESLLSDETYKKN